VGWGGWVGGWVGGWGGGDSIVLACTKSGYTLTKLINYCHETRETAADDLGQSKSHSIVALSTNESSSPPFLPTACPARHGARREELVSNSMSVT
jgi:hypothetical protein